MRDHAVVRTAGVDLGVESHRQARSALDGVGVDLAVGQHEAAHLVDAVKVLAGERGRHGRDLAFGRRLGLGNGGTDRFNGKLDVLDAAGVNARGGHLAEAQHGKLPGGTHLAHGNRNLARADVECGNG